MIPSSTLVYDIETDSQDTSKANLKWFGAYSYQTKEYYMYDFNQKDEICELLDKHKYIIGFNNNSFDNPITERFTGEEYFSFTGGHYKIILDLWECLSPGMSYFGFRNKNRLAQMNIQLPNYKLKTICEYLKLDDEGSKGDIDYKIFQKDEWAEDEKEEIKKYLKQDIALTKKLFEWYEKQFEPMGELLSYDDRRKLKHLKSSIASLSYAIICNQTGMEVKFEENQPQNLKSYPGGHHINPRWELVIGNIIEIDFASAYPHAMMMGNLYSPVETDGWKGDDYYIVDGVYNNKKQGKVENVIKDIFIKRLQAKESDEKEKNMSYKLIINSAYGLTGNWRFKQLYNPTTAADCTHIVRTWMKRLAKRLEEEDFKCLYGFTDSIFVKIPKESDKKELMVVVNKVLEEFKSHVPFPLETFKMDIEEEIKLIWFLAKNCYMFVTKDDEIKYKSTLFNKNTPAVIMKVFEDYITPKIIKNLDIDFTEKELVDKIRECIEKDIYLASQKYSISDLESYKSRSSIQYQICERYGPGEHFLIPNKKSLGIGKSKTTKKRVGVRHCTIEDFQEKNLKVADIDITQLLKHLKPFFNRNEKLNYEQTKLTL